jgi:hypothetical protein
MNSCCTMIGFLMCVCVVTELIGDTWMLEIMQMQPTGRQGVAKGLDSRHTNFKNNIVLLQKHRH